MFSLNFLEFFPQLSKLTSVKIRVKVPLLNSINPANPYPWQHWMVYSLQMWKLCANMFWIKCCVLSVNSHKKVKLGPDLKARNGNECLSHTNIFEWYGKFCNDWKSMDNDPSAGHPRTSQTLEHITKYTLHWQTINVQRSECRPNSSTLIKKPFVKLSRTIRGKKSCVRDLFHMCWCQNNWKIV